MDLENLDRRQIALVASRGRCVVGLLCIFWPSLVARVWMGRSEPAVNAMTRVVGIRDLALGIGALTAIKEQHQDAEWLSMGAVCDGFDAVVSLATPGLPKRARLIGLFAGAMAAATMKLSRDFADERQTPPAPVPAR